MIILGVQFRQHVLRLHFTKMHLSSYQKRTRVKQKRIIIRLLWLQKRDPPFQGIFLSDFEQIEE